MAVIVGWGVVGMWWYRPRIESGVILYAEQNAHCAVIHFTEAVAKGAFTMTAGAGGQRGTVGPDAGINGVIHWSRRATMSEGLSIAGELFDTRYQYQSSRLHGPCMHIQRDRSS
jgi:hypothetical protein